MCQYISLLVAASVIASAGPRQYTFNHENVLGTSLELKVYASMQAEADRAESAVLSEIDRQAKIHSGYDPESEFSRWFKTHDEPVVVSADLFEVLRRFDRYRALTHGALDPAAEAAVQVWKSAAVANRLPSQAEIRAAVRAAQGLHWSLDPIRHTATHKGATPLILNSFTKSYIAGHAAGAAMGLPGIEGVVVNIGGDIVVRGSLPETVSIADPGNDAENSEPIAQIQVRDRAIATSGSYRRRVRIGGRFYSHIVDPRTGEPADRILSSTVIARDPSDAGALATAFSVLQPEESARVAAKIPGVEYLLITRGRQRIASPGWRAYAVALASPPQSAPRSAAGQWDRDYELIVTFELARIGGARVHRPYVAVWIEDKDGGLVRTIGLWYQKPRWLPELRAWHAKQARAAAQQQGGTASISSATRPPGKYTLQWDGKDNNGNLVKPGMYTVNIEAAREHGTYQILRQDMDFNSTPKQIALRGGTEISAASLDYVRKTN